MLYIFSILHNFCFAPPRSAAHSSRQSADRVEELEAWDELNEDWQQGVAAAAAARCDCEGAS